MFTAHSGQKLGSKILGGLVILAAGSSAHAVVTSYGWFCYGGNYQHTGQSQAYAKDIDTIRWSCPVDLNPQYFGNSLLIHYGTPLITPQNNVIVTVKTGAVDGFKLEARRGLDGALLYTENTDYSRPPQGWIPSCGSTLAKTPNSLKWRIFTPGAGGTVLMRDDADNPNSAVTRICFYGLSNYNANQAIYNSNVKINTPISADSEGNVYFGFMVLGNTPLGLQGGIVRISNLLQTKWLKASQAANDPNISRCVMNSTPVIGINNGLLYEAFTGGGYGYLVLINSAAMTPMTRVRLKDPRNSNDAGLPEQGTASPMVGPDGDVYFGVMGNPYNRSRGFMLHYNLYLNQTKIPGAFGWDDTATIVNRSCVPSYLGSSPYLILTKYNNSAGTGGDGVNKLAVLDPRATQIDFATGATTMKDILTVTGPTPDPEFFPAFPNAVREWCINTAAVDPVGCAMVNSEDGKLYEWDLKTNLLEDSLVLTPGIGEAYTPTLIGPDGTTYAINNATLFACGPANAHP